MIEHLIVLGLIGSVARCGETPPPPVVRVASGGAVRVPCPLASPGASVQWTHAGAPVVLGEGRAWAVGAGGAAALAIEAARPADAGEWGCRETTPGGAEARVLILEVTSVPSPPWLELEGVRLLHQATVTVKAAHALSLHCVVEGALPPVHQVHWFVGSTNATPSAELFVEFSADAGAYTSRSVLPLNASRQLHGAEVVCRPRHHAWLQGAAAASLALNVLYEPSFSISRDPGFGRPLVAGMRVSLECSVDANPPSAPLWVRDDAPGPPLPPGGALAFEPVDPEAHAGWYRCTTDNPVFGYFASFGYFLNVRAADPSDSSPESEEEPTAGCEGSPSVSAAPSSVSGVSGGATLLQGRVCGGRPLRVFWIARHAALAPGDAPRPPHTAHPLTAVPGGCWLASLEVSPLSALDAGEVVLVAAGAGGSAAHALFRVNVTRAAPATSDAAAVCRPPCPAPLLLMLLMLMWALLDHR